MNSMDSTIIVDAIAYAEELFRTNAGGLWMTPSGTFMISCCISNH